MGRLIDVDAMINKMTKELESEMFDNGTVALANCFIKILNEQPTANVDKDVREEAYNKGRRDALQEVQNCESYGYEKGLNDAWKVAKKIQGLDCKIREKIYGIYKMLVIFEKFTPQEALAKLEAYEKEQAEIKVGDVVKDGKKYFLVTKKYNNTFEGMTGEGYLYCGLSLRDCKKTGKHIDIQSILQQIGGDVNGNS